MMQLDSSVPMTDTKPMYDTPIVVPKSSRDKIRTVRGAADEQEVLNFDLCDIPETKESDDEIIVRMRSRFKMLERMTTAISDGSCRSMVVCGAPGIGKTEGVERVLRERYIKDMLETDSLKPHYEVIGGDVSPVGMYMKLYEWSESGNVLVFDDCDEAIRNVKCLNLLKHALDTGGKKRILSWAKDSRTLREADVPNSFEFKGGVIVITNVNFDYVTNKSLKIHLQALDDRSHVLDLTIHTPREKMLRIKQCINDGMLNKSKLTDDQVFDLIGFIEQHRNKIRQLTLRTVVKIVELMHMEPDMWRDYANVTIMREIR